MNITDKKWASRLVTMAHNVAAWSKDTSTKVGAVITTKEGRPISWGFNGMPAGIDDNIQARTERPLKYKWTAHAERNAMDLAMVPDLTGHVMFVTFFPCASCAQSIIQKGIKTIVVDANYTPDKMPERWKEDIAIAEEMLKEAGVEIIAAYPEEH